MAASWYRTGTLTLTNGSAEVSGAGTAFLANVRNGDMLIGPVMDMYEIAEVVSDSKVKLARPYAGAGYTGDSWEIAPTTAQLKQLARQIADLVAIYQDIPEAATAVLGAVARVEAAEQSAKDSAASANAAAALAVSAKTDAAESAATATGAATAAIAARDGASASQGAAEAAAQQSISAAATANQTAEEVRGIAQEAKDSATHAVQVAEGIDGKATQALAASQDATTKAESAQTIASASDTKAQQAQAASAGAVTKADAAVSEATSAASLAMRVATAVGSVDWWPLRSSIPAGRIPADGQTVSRATFPDLAAMVVAGTVPVATESDWLADPRNRGCYTAGDGSTTIRVPDLNGRSSGTLGRIFLSGDGADSNGVWGVIQRDQFQKHHHYINLKTASGAADVYGTSPYGSGTGSQYSTWGEAIQFNPQVGPPRSGDKTHPQNVAGVWTVQAFGAVTNPGSADAAQLASDYAVLNAGFQTLNAAFQTVRGQAFGVGQSMQNVAGSRTIGVAYTNTTGRPIVVYISGDTNTSAGGNLGITIGGLFVTRSIWASQGIALAVTAVIPPGIAYVANASGISLSQWQEYR